MKDPRLRRGRLVSLIATYKQMLAEEQCQESREIIDACVWPLDTIMAKKDVIEACIKSLETLLADGDKGIEPARFVILGPETEVDDVTGERLYWHNLEGWTTFEEATRFYPEDLILRPTPLVGSWAAEALTKADS
jgi:hypothetical protein